MAKNTTPQKTVAGKELEAKAAKARAAAAAKAKPSDAPLFVEVEIPVPAKQSGGGRISKYAAGFERLLDTDPCVNGDAGTAVFFPECTVKQIYPAASSYSKRHNITLCCRSTTIQGTDGVSVHKTADHFSPRKRKDS